MAGTLPPIVVAITASAAGLKTELGKAKGEIAGFGTSTSATLGAASKVGTIALTGLAVGAVAVGGASVKMAGDFQESITQLQTGAGESAANLGMVSAGILNMAGQVGVSAQALSAGMYQVDSAGYKAADGLTVLKAAAQGAKLGNADMTTVANGLTTALTDYHLSADQAATVTSKLVTTVASGKTTMGELSASLSAVMPSAAAAGVGMDQVLGALATMTGQGISAQQASQNLASSIASLQNPTSVASKAMAQMGLNSTDVAAQLGQKGLTGTLDEMAQAVMQHMGPAGLVLQSSMNESKLAAQSAQQMLTQLPPSIQKIAKGYLDGTVTQKQWMKEMKNQPALVANLGKQFATTVKQANGFSDTLKAGKGSAQTFNAVMSDMTGGQTGLNVALALTGKNMDTFKGNVDAISGASAEAGGNVKNWGEVQKDFNFKIQASASYLNSVGIKLGTALIPMIEKTMDVTASVVAWFGKNTTAAKALGIGAGVLAGAFIGTSVALKAYNTVQGISKVLSGESTAATTLQAAALGAQKVALGVATAAQWLWNNAITDNPIGLIIVGVAALTAGVIYAYNHFETFRNIVNGVWSWLKGAVVNTINFVKDHWQLILEIITGPIGMAVGVISSHWDSIVGFFKAAPGRIGDAIKGVASFITAPFRAAFNAVGSLWNNTIGKLNITVPSWVPGIGGKGFSFPQIPALANGTHSFGGGVALVGENGPELAELPSGTKVTPAPQTKSLLNGRANAGNGSGPLINIEHFHADGRSEQQIAASLAFRLRTT